MIDLSLSNEEMIYLFCVSGPLAVPLLFECGRNLFHMGFNNSLFGKRELKKANFFY